METTPSRPVRVRYAPSPTGYLHIGGLRTALYNWLFARRHQGTFILRIEDTDRSRYVEGSIEKMCQMMKYLGLDPDEGVRLEDGALRSDGPCGPYLQSERRERHRAYAQQLLTKRLVYYCFCSEERLAKLSEEQHISKKPSMYDRLCRSLLPEEAERRVKEGEPHVVRLAVPLDGVCVAHDLIRGRIEIPWSQIDDQVLIKSDGFPTYHLAATMDDHDMKISHVLRGDEWISSLPKHLFLYQAFGWEPPQFAHLPLLFNSDHSKLSKRQGDVAVEEYLKKGYLIDALINFVALLGWNPTADREIFQKEELAALFEIEKVNKSGAVFNIEKLNWLNAHYLREMPEERFFSLLAERGALSSLEEERRAALVVRPRATTLEDVPRLVSELRLRETDLQYEPSLLFWKIQTPAQTAERLSEVGECVNNFSEEIFSSVGRLEEAMRAKIQEQNWQIGETLWPLRVALSGLKASPSPFELLYVYGKERSLGRISQARQKLTAADVVG